MQALDIWIGGLGRGGTETHLVRTLPQLKALGWHIRVFLFSTDRTLAAPLEAHGISIEGPTARQLAWTHLFKPQWLRRLITLGFTWLRLQDYYRHRGERLVHFYLPQAYILGTLAAWWCRRTHNILMSRRSLNHYQRWRVIKWLERWLHHIPMAVIGNSQAVTTQLVEEEAVPLKKIHLIYNGVLPPAVLTAAARQALRQRLGLASQRVICVT